MTQRILVSDEKEAAEIALEEFIEETAKKSHLRAFADLSKQQNAENDAKQKANAQIADAATIFIAKRWASNQNPISEKEKKRKSKFDKATPIFAEGNKDSVHYAANKKLKICTMAEYLDFYTTDADKEEQKQVWKEKIEIHKEAMNLHKNEKIAIAA